MTNEWQRKAPQATARKQRTTTTDTGIPNRKIDGGLRDEGDCPCRAPNFGTTQKQGSSRRNLAIVVLCA